MLANNNEFRFNISISKRGYATKEEAIAALPYYKDRIKKIPNPQVDYFTRHSVNIDELANFITQGHTTCGVYDAPKEFTASWKNLQRFRYTNCLFFDIDDAQCTMTELLDSVPYVPTISYRTFSDGVKGNRYRFVYVFEDYINKYNFGVVYNKVAEACNLPPELDVRNCVQCYYGTDKKDIYNSNLIYNFEDFNIEISQYDSESVTIDSFQVKYHSDLILSENQHYYTFPEPYYEVWHKYSYNPETKKTGVVKIKDGEGRRRSLWKVGQVLMVLNPQMPLSVLTKALQREVELFYDNTEDTISISGDSRSIEGIAESVYNNYDKYPITQSKHKGFKINKTYWQSVMSVGNEVYKPIIAVAKCRGEINQLLFEQYYNPALTPKENIEILRSNNVDISRATFFRHKKNSSVKSQTYNYSASAFFNNIIRLMRLNELIRIEEIAQAIGCDRNKVNREIKKLKDKGIIRREGTKRNYRWVILKDIDSPKN